MRRLLIRTILLLVATASAGTLTATAQVHATADTYVIGSDSTLVVDAPGVLANDISVDSIGARLVSGPVFGQVHLRSDGSFEYTPPAGFTGRDSLTYVAQVLEPTVFTIDSSATRVTIEADLSSSFGSDSDVAESSVGGTVAAYLLPSGPPLYEIHVADFELILLDSLHLEFGSGFTGVTADVEAGGMSVRLLESGGPVRASGTDFDQPENRVRLETTATLRSVVQSGDQHIVVDTVIALTGSIRSSTAGDSLFLDLPLDFSGTYEVSGAVLDLEVSGTLMASARLETAVESQETLVSIEVGTIGTSIATAELPSSAVLHPAYPNPFNPQTVVAYELPQAGIVRLSAFDAIGREVVVLASGMRSAGRHEVVLDAAGLPGGVYFLRLETGDALRVQKAVVLK